MRQIVVPQEQEGKVLVKVDFVFGDPVAKLIFDDDTFLYLTVDRGHVFDMPPWLSFINVPEAEQ